MTESRLTCSVFCLTTCYYHQIKPHACKVNTKRLQKRLLFYKVFHPTGFPLSAHHECRWLFSTLSSRFLFEIVGKLITDPFVAGTWTFMKQWNEQGGNCGSFPVKRTSNTSFWVAEARVWKTVCLWQNTQRIQQNSQLTSCFPTPTPLPSS